jgi:hypothetical protein
MMLEKITKGTNRSSRKTNNKNGPQAGGEHSLQRRRGPDTKTEKNNNNRE